MLWMVVLSSSAQNIWKTELKKQSISCHQLLASICMWGKGWEGDPKTFSVYAYNFWHTFKNSGHIIRHSAFLILCESRKDFLIFIIISLYQSLITLCSVIVCLDFHYSLCFIKNNTSTNISVDINFIYFQLISFEWLSQNIKILEPFFLFNNLSVLSNIHQFLSIDDRINQLKLSQLFSIFHIFC